MEDALFYPPLDETTVKNLDLVRQLSAEHPSYWLTSEYPMNVERLVKSWFDPQTIKALVKKAHSEDEDEKPTPALDEDRNEYLYQETVSLYKEMKLAKYAGSNEDSMAYFKTAVSLQEKLIGFQERALGMKQVSDYHRAVMDIMENILTKQQRDEVIARLQQALGQ